MLHEATINYLICDREEDCFAGEACPVPEPLNEIKKRSLKL